MATITVDGINLNVELRGMHRVLGLRRGFRIPLEHVRGATADPGMFNEPKGWRGPGANVPGLLYVGTFHKNGQRSFWAVRDKSKAVVIELHGERYERMVLQVDDPRAAVAVIERALIR